MAKIIAPNKKYNGTSANVSFRDGIGETDDPHRIQWFKEHGYEVIESDKPKKEKTFKDSVKQKKEKEPEKSKEENESQDEEKESQDEEKESQDEEKESQDEEKESQDEEKESQDSEE